MDEATLASFMEKVQADPVTGCWLWLRQKNEHGYGRFRNRPAHIVAYEHFVGAVPEGLELGHTCTNKCANWQHVRPITHSQNVREGAPGIGHANKAKTHCPKNHPYTAENTRYNSRGGRVCRTCAGWTGLR